MPIRALVRKENWALVRIDCVMRDHEKPGKSKQENMAGLRNLFYLVLTAFSTLVLIIIVRTVMFSNQPTAAVPCKPSDLDFIPADDAVKKRFQTAITFKTVSYDVGIYNREELYKFLQFILAGEQVMSLTERFSVCCIRTIVLIVDGDKPRLFARFEVFIYFPGAVLQLVAEEKHG